MEVLPDFAPSLGKFLPEPCVILQLCLKGDTAWNCCTGKLCPVSHAHSFIVTYTSLGPALQNASTSSRDSWFWFFFPVIYQKLSGSHCTPLALFVFIFLFKLHNTQSQQVSGMRLGVTEVLLDALPAVNYLWGSNSRPSIMAHILSPKPRLFS